MIDYLTANLEDLPLHFGMINFTEEPSPAAISSAGYLLNDCADLKKRYISLGFHLDEFAINQYYRDFGYNNLYDFAFDNLGLDRSAVSRCLNVWQVFSKKQNGVATMFIDEKYEDYSYSQLTEMLSIPDDKRKNITPDLTVKQIRDYKKSLKKLSEPASTPSSSTVFSDAFSDLTLLDSILEFIQKKYTFPLGGGFVVSGKVIRITSGGETYNITFSHAKK